MGDFLIIPRNQITGQLGITLLHEYMIQRAQEPKNASQRGKA